MQYSIVNYSEVAEHKDKRIDSEHYHPYHRDNLKKFKAQSRNLGDYILHMSGGATPLGAKYPETGIPFLRVENIMQNYISESNMVYLTESQHNAILRSALKKNDVLLTITGAYGKSAVVTRKFAGANINQHSVKMTVAGILPHFLATFLNCKYGYSQSTSHVVGITRPALDYSAIRNFYIPNLSNSFQNALEKACLQSENTKKNSDSTYQKAQDMLLAELGLEGWQPKHKLSFVKKYADVRQAGRFDAEYFQPKYDKIIKEIKKYNGGWDTLGNLANLKTKNYTPSDTQEYKYIELANIASNGEIAGCTIAKGQDLPNRARRKVSKNDIIVSSIEGSLESIALIREEYNRNSLCSTGFHVINSETLNSETLLVFLKSIAGQMQLKKGCNGTILTAINDDEFCKLVLPILPDKKQKRIQAKVIESFKLRDQSKQLLECAKRAVEIAIEKNEKKALQYLEQETKKISA